MAFFNQSWLEVESSSDFPWENIPFGIFQIRNGSPRVGTIIGSTVIDLQVLAAAGKFSGIISDTSVFSSSTLNRFIALGKPITLKIRERIQELFYVHHRELKNDPSLCEAALIPYQEVQMLMPLQIPNYTDFYSSKEHATNVGKLFRPDNPLMPNWLHLPVAYHGRASSIVVSGTPIRRPKGQTKPDDADMPVFGPSRALDFEL
ncbi:MAG: fumarylacetoacetate hydrolase family protein, partial [Chitinophagales bacterium]|nr:fumarylacetoacetate hydrolase family protein [Chitinophagales bacterium]